MANNSNDSNKTYKEYVKQESLGSAVGKAAGAALLKTVWDFFQSYAKSKTKFYIYWNNFSLVRIIMS